MEQSFFRIFRSVDREVVDETKLPGKYDVSLRWSPGYGAALDSNPSEKPVGGSIPQSDSDAVSIFTAIQEQLGLKLEAANAPVETLVVEHVEQPSEN